MLKILADENIYKLAQFFPEEVEITFYNPDHSIPSPDGFDVLLVSTISKINAKTFSTLPSSLKVIGTASSGSDHIDNEYFEAQGIKVIDAKGCNANTVGEYVVTSLLLWSIKRKKKLQDYTIGIIGAGATGSALAKQLRKFDISFVLYDPPKEKRESDFKSASMDEILNCDILSFHVPLTTNTMYPTYHWLDQEKLEGNKFELIVNASRGGIIDERSILTAMDEGTVSDIVIDVWEQEPDFNTILEKKAFIATPHIAGYSEQGKLNASKIIADKLSEIFSFQTPEVPELFQPKIIDLARLNYSLYDLILRLHPMREYDVDLREIAKRPDKKALFQKLRRDRPLRFEYPYLQLNNSLIHQFKTLNILGVKSLNLKK